MSDVSYLLDFADDDVYADASIAGGNGEAWPTLTPGREITVSLWFGTTPATDGVGRTEQERFEAARHYVETAREGVVTINRPPSGPRYDEELTASDPSSLVVGFFPSGRLQDLSARRFWGIIVGGSDLSNAVRTRYQLEFDVVVLGLVADYATRTDIEALSNSLI